MREWEQRDSRNLPRHSGLKGASHDGDVGSHARMFCCPPAAPAQDLGNLSAIPSRLIPPPTHSAKGVPSRRTGQQPLQSVRQPLQQPVRRRIPSPRMRRDCTIRPTTIAASSASIRSIRTRRAISLAGMVRRSRRIPSTISLGPGARFATTRRTIHTARAGGSREGGEGSA